MAVTSVGIDISDQSIEVVELSRGEKGYRVINQGRLELETGVIERGLVKNINKLKQAVMAAFKTAKPNAIKTEEIIFGLPESRTYVHVFDIPASNKQTIEAGVAKAIEETIPITPEETRYAYITIPAPGVAAGKADGTVVLAAAVKRDTLVFWHDFFRGLGLRVKLFDIEILAQFRGAKRSLPEAPLALLDLGARTSYLAVFTKQGLAYSCSIPIAGEDITMSISRTLAVDRTEAEKIKRNDGLSGMDNCRIAQIAVLNRILDEIILNLGYFTKKSGLEVNDILILGGTSRLKGLSRYFKEKLPDTRIESAAPMTGDSDSEIIYIEAIGLAVRGLERRWQSTDPGFVYSSGNGEIEQAGEKQTVNNWLFPLLSKVIYKKITTFTIAAIVLIMLVLAIIIFLNPRSDYTPINTEIDYVPVNDRPITSVSTSSDNMDMGGTEADFLIRIENLGSNLNVRSSPNTSAGIIGQALPGQVYPLIEEGEEWHKIKFENHEGWVYAGFTEKITK